ncbi:MAG: SelB C-terminal domain-containing protein, partial [Pseudoflavonifractor sp.]
PVCAPTGAGIAALQDCIAAMVNTVPPRDAAAPFRMSIDRVFSKDGFGTIATGTAVQGTVHVGDMLERCPHRKLLRVRALQSHNAPAEQLAAGQRVALNLAGIERSALCRGDVLAAPGCLTLTNCADGVLSLLPDAPLSVKNGTQLHFYCGTRELLCRCTLKGRSVLAPGQSAGVRLRFTAPLAAQSGDRFVVRFLSPAVTAGGGILHDLAPRKKQPAPPQSDPQTLAVALLRAYHEAFPLREGMSRQALGGKLGSEEAVDVLAAAGVLRLRGDWVSLPAFRPKYTPPLAALRDKMELTYRRERLAPEPNLQVERALGAAAGACRQVAERLVKDGVLIPLDARYRIHSHWLGRAEETLRALFAAEGAVTLPRFRDASGTSRRYALLLLEYWDRTGVTENQGNTRILPKFD